MSWEEGVAVCRESLHLDLARTFLRFLAETRNVGPGADASGRHSDVSGLRADLLGATLIDAQDELVAAWTTLDRQGSNAPSSARAWLTDSPPWPPASIDRLQKRGGEDALTLVEDLAGQIAPDPAVRLALLQSWLRPRRQIDDVLLAELTSAADGRLVREPRFRSWLRGMDGLGQRSDIDESLAWHRRQCPSRRPSPHVLILPEPAHEIRFHHDPRHH